MTIIGGEGGMATTNDPFQGSAMWFYKNHGNSFEAIDQRAHQPGFRWPQASLGTNLRMTEMQAVIDCIQLRHMAERTRICNLHAAPPAEVPSATACAEGPVVPVANGSDHVRYKCYVYLRPDQLAERGSRSRTLEEINPRGVPCMQRACSEVSIEKAFGNTGRRPAAPLPVARRLDQTSLMFLVHPTIEDSHIDTAVDAIHEMLGQAGKKGAGRVTEATARTCAPFFGDRPALKPRSRVRAARVLGWADQIQLPC